MFQWFIRFPEIHWISLPFWENSFISFFVNCMYFIACNLIRRTEATGWNRQHKSVKLNGSRHSFIAQMKTNKRNKKRMFSCHFGEECVSEFRVTMTTWPRLSGIKLRLENCKRKSKLMNAVPNRQRPSYRLHQSQELYRRSPTDAQSGSWSRQPMILATGTYWRHCTVQWRHLVAE